MNNEMNFNELNLEELENVSGGASAGKKIKATGDTVNVRKGPGLDYAIAGTITKGTCLEFLGEIKTDNRGVYWGKVSYKGNAVWISSKYAKMV